MSLIIYVNNLNGSQHFQVLYWLKPFFQFKAMKRKLNNVNKSTPQAMYFDKLLQMQSKNKGMLNTPN